MVYFDYLFIFHKVSFDILLALDDRQETSLIEIMVCCVKQAATGEYPVGRGTASRKVSNRETRQVAEDKTKLTEHFIVTLPQLLAKVTFVVTRSPTGCI